MENKEQLIEKWKAADGDDLSRYRAREFIDIMGDGEIIKEFDIDLIFRMVEKMVVLEREKIIVSFLDGTEVEYVVE